MLCSTRDDHKFAWRQFDDFVAKFKAKITLISHEHFIVRFVLVPRKFALEFNDFYTLAVKFANEFWPPMLIDQLKFFTEVHFIIHAYKLFDKNSSSKSPNPTLNRAVP